MAKKEKSDSDQILDKMRGINAAIDRLTEAKAAYSHMFAEIGNAEKVFYADRDTGEQKPRGVDDAKMEAWAQEAESKISDAISALQ